MGKYALRKVLNDINKPFVPGGTTAYMSFLLNVQNTTGLTSGNYFTGFGQSAGASVTLFLPSSGLLIVENISQIL